MTINKDIEQITKDDLQSLVDDSVLESKTIEYKQSLPGDSEAAKKEFLADISSFANASGGDLIYGMVQDPDTGNPKELQGLNIANVDEEISRLDNLVRTGLQPRLPFVNIRPIPLENSKVAIIIRVPKSWIAPHRVILGGHDKFYSRNSSGKYPLDVSELRIAFNLSETVTERIRNFRLDRISKIFANETPVPFYETAKIVLHLIPIISFNPAQAYDIGKIASHREKMPPIYASGWSYRYTLEGFLTYSEDKEGKSRSYVQLFRNGIIEAIEGRLLRPRRTELKIPSIAYEQELIKSLSIAYEQELIKSLSNYIAVLKALNVEPPIFVFLTLLGVKGYSMGLSLERYDTEGYQIDRNVLQLPEVIIESYDVRAADVLKPCFDSIWNACGFPGSFNYNDKGEWAPR